MNNVFASRAYWTLHPEERPAAHMSGADASPSARDGSYNSGVTVVHVTGSQGPQSITHLDKHTQGETLVQPVHHSYSQPIRTGVSFARTDVPVHHAELPSDKIYFQVASCDSHNLIIKGNKQRPKMSNLKNVRMTPVFNEERGTTVYVSGKHLSNGILHFQQ